MVRIPDLIAGKIARHRMGKLRRKLEKDPGDPQVLSEMWLRCRQFTMYIGDAYPIDYTPELAIIHMNTADEIGEGILKALGPNEIADRIEHLDDFQARSLRDTVDDVTFTAPPGG